MRDFIKSSIGFFITPLKLSHFYSKTILGISLLHIVILSLETIHIRLREYKLTHNWQTGIEFILGYDSVNYTNEGYETIIMLSLIALAQMIIIISWLIFMSNKYQIPNILTKAWKLGFILNFYVLSFPLFNAMVSILIKSAGLNAENDYVNILLASMNIFLNILISSPGYVNIQLKTNDPFGRWNNKYYLFTQTHKYLLSLILLLIRNSTNFNLNPLWIISLSNLAFSIVESTIIVSNLPFFSKCMNLTVVYFQSYILAISLSTCLFLDIGIDKKFLIETCIIFTLFVAPLCAKLIFVLSAKKEHEVYPATLAKADSRFAYINHKTLMKMFKSSTRKILINDAKKIVESVELKTIIDSIKFKQYSNHAIDSDSEKDLRDCLKLYLDQRYSHATKIQEKLILAFLYLKYHEEIYRPLTISLSIIKDQKVGENTRLAAHWILDQIKFKISSKLNENLKETNLNSYFQNLAVYDSLMKKITLQLSEYKKFYLKINEPSPLLLDIFTTSKKIQEINKKIDYSWGQISDEFKQMSSKILRNYALYKIILRADADKGFDLMKKYDKNMVKRATINKNLPDLSRKIYEPNSFSVEVSIEKENFGDIIRADFSTIDSQLGFSKADLLNKNLSKLYPLSLRDQLVNLLADSIQNSSKIGKIESSLSFLLHKEGHVSLYTYVFMMHPNTENGLRYLCVYNPIKSKDEYLLMSNSGTLETATFHAYRDLKGNLKEKKFDMKTQFYKEAGYELTQVSEKEDFVSRCRSRYQSVFIGTGDLEKEGQSIESPTKNDKERIKIYHLTKAENEKKKIAQEEKERREEDFGKSTLEILPVELEVPEKEGEPEKSQTTITEIFEKKESQEFESEHNNHDKFDEIEVQSVKSVSSEHITLAKMKHEFYHLLSRQDLYTFYDRFLLLASISVALILITIALFFCYDNATNSMTEVQNGVNFVKDLYGRTSTITDIARTTYQDFSTKLYQRNFTTAVLNRIEALRTNGPPRISLLASYQQNAKLSLNNMDETNLQNKFFERNIRVYYDDYYQITNSTKYTLMNNFEAVDSLINSAYYYIKIIGGNDTELLDRGLYILTLSMNDLWIVMKELPNHALNAIHHILDDINTKTDIIYACCVAGLVVYFLSMIAVFIKYYQEALKFLIALCHGESGFNIEMYQSISEFEKKILGGSKSRELSSKILEKEKSKDKKLTLKRTHTRNLFLSFCALKVISMTLIMIPSIVLLYSSYKYPGETSTLVSTALKDMKNLNEISQGVIELVTDSNLYDYVPRIFTKNVKPSDVYQAEIDILDELISQQKGFSSQGLEYLSRNLCPYFIRTTSNATCQSIINGQAQNGIKSVVYYLQQFHMSLKAYSDSFTDQNARAIALSSTTQKSQALLAALNILNPGVRAFSDEITNDLVATLQKRVDQIITLFGVSLFVNISVMLLVITWIMGALKRERLALANTMVVVPLDFVTSNKMLKMYLIKKSRDFFRLSKELDKRRKNSS